MVLMNTLPTLLFLFCVISRYHLTTGTIRTEFSPFKHAAHSPTFVDKTNFIKDFIRKIPKGRRLALLTAPMGFGKTTNLDMLRQFFDLTVNKIGNETVVDKSTTENYKLFSKMNIFQHKESMKDHFCQYPVIYMDFATFGDNFAAGIIKRISEIYAHYNALSNYTMKTMRLPDPAKTNLTHSMNRLANLARKLRHHFNTKVMLLIDNYEQPVLNMVEKKATMEDIYGFNDQTICVLIRILNRFVAYTVLTGIHQMLKASLVGGCRHPNSLCFLAEHFATGYYGFTEEEVFVLFDKFNLTKKERRQVAINCNGYRPDANFTALYNPAPVVKYLNGKRPESAKYLRNYTLRTGVLAENLYKFLRMPEVRAHLVGVLWYRKERVSFDRRIWITDFDYLREVLFTDNQVKEAKTLFFTYLYETGHFHTGAFPNFGIVANDQIQRQLNAEVRKYYMLKYNMKFDKIINALTPIVTKLQTTDEMLRTLEDALTDTFKPLYDTRDDMDGGRFIYPELDFEAIVYCAATTRFHFTHGVFEVRVSDHYIRLLEENRVSADVITDTIPGRIDMGILSDDLKIALLIQICHNETLEEGLDAVSDLVPVHYKPQIVKYLAINVDLEYKAKAASLSNYNVSAPFSNRRTPGSDYSSYDVFDRSEVVTERGWMTEKTRKTVSTIRTPSTKRTTSFQEYIQNFDISHLIPSHSPKPRPSKNSVGLDSYDVSGLEDGAVPLYKTSTSKYNVPFDLDLTI